jgi:hypothetical protein
MVLTQQTGNALVAAVFSLLAIGRGLYPSPIWNRWSREPFGNQLLARMVYIGLGPLYASGCVHHLHAAALTVHSIDAQTASPAIAAVSARRILVPNVTGFHPTSSNSFISSGAHPPSGPIASATLST